jgi:dihydroorotase-like cyclic amidohydrolase
MEMRMLIKGGTVVDGSGAVPAYAADVRISGGRITEIAPNLQATKGERVVDAAGNRSCWGGFNHKY